MKYASYFCLWFQDHYLFNENINIIDKVEDKNFSNFI